MLNIPDLKFLVAEQDLEESSFIYYADKDCEGTRKDGDRKEAKSAKLKVND